MTDTYRRQSINDSDTSVQAQTATGAFTVLSGRRVVTIAATAAATTPTFPAAAGSVGDTITVVNQGTDTATVTAAAGDSIVGAAAVATVTAASFTSNGVDAWVRAV